jgi:acetyl esterase/lipase
MTISFALRQAVNAVASVNALRPMDGPRSAVPAFLAGWLTSELAPQLLAATAVDAGIHVARRGVRTPTDRIGLALAAASAAGLAATILTGSRAGAEMDAALAEVGIDLPGRAVDWRSSSRPFSYRREGVRRVRNLAYAPGGKRFLVDVYHHRDTPADAPMLLQVHGGGWVIGNKDQQGLPLMVEMASRGWVCAAVNYPLSPKAVWPDHLVALKRAVGWMRAEGPQYGGDPGFLAVTGGSAGGHLSTMLALTANDAVLQPGFEDVDTSVQACVPFYGAYDFTGESGIPAVRWRVESKLTRMVLGRDAVFPDSYLAASPLAKLHAGAPPFLVIHGTNDSLIPVAEARDFVRRLREVSDNPVAYAELRGAQHAFDLFHSLRSDQVTTRVAAFLEWTRARAEEGTESAQQSVTQ